MIDISGFITRQTAVKRKGRIKLKDIGASLVRSNTTRFVATMNMAYSRRTIENTRSREWKVGSKINSPTYSVDWMIREMMYEKRREMRRTRDQVSFLTWF